MLARIGALIDPVHEATRREKIPAGIKADGRYVDLDSLAARATWIAELLAAVRKVVTLEDRVNRLDVKA